ncbi:MAG: hypothetical protein HND43_10525 [Armatimonadetes bacterium]|jgi:hypothetical protein|nr:hypothetical protein [Armatimonadota bacterium]NOG39808.1 hypothetical protein [Armatimonadota bacterium]
MDTKPITEQERALLRMPSIASQFPVEIAGGVGWSEFTGECRFCKQDIPDDLLRGAVSRPLPSVAVIEAVGVCPHCKIATTFLYRLHDDMRITGPRADGWRTWRPAPTVWQRIRDFFGFPAMHRGSSK